MSAILSPRLVVYIQLIRRRLTSGDYNLFRKLQETVFEMGFPSLWLYNHIGKFSRTAFLLGPVKTFITEK